MEMIQILDAAGIQGENVPLLFVKEGMRGKILGQGKLFQMWEQCVCDYFGVESPQNGTSFLKL